MTQKTKATLKIDPETRDRLFHRKEGPGESYDDVLQRLLDRTSD